MKEAHASVAPRMALASILRSLTMLYDKGAVPITMNVKPAAVSQGIRPDRLRFGRIPRSFKGDILYSRLKQDFLDSLESGRLSVR